MSLGRRIGIGLGSLWLGIGLALAPAGCDTTAPVTSGSPPPTRSALPSSPSDTVEAADWARLEEAWRLVETVGPDLWPGWGERPPPLLLRVGAVDYLVGHPSPPRGFEAVPELEVAGSPVLRRAGNLVDGIGVQQIGDRLGIALLRRAELQALLDKQLGPGVVGLDDVQYVRWIVHEAFHVHQFQALAMDLPRFGFAGNEMEEVAKLEKDGSFAAQLSHEARLLRDALSADDESLPVKVEAFLTARVARRERVAGDVAGLEQAVEWAEGLARYTDVLALRAAGGDYQPSAAFVALGATYAEPEEAWQQALAWLDDLSSVPGTLRDRYYELGAAEAYLLDRLMPGWHQRAFPGAESLEALLADALRGAQRGIPPALRSLSLVELRLDSRAYLVAVADAPDEWRRGLAGVADLGPLDGLLFEFPGAIDAPFHMSGAATALDVAFFAGDGRCLGVASMALCATDPCATYRAPAPYRWALEVPAGGLTDIGQGMQLELARY